jgi:ribonucleoside-triphosphate reductase
VDTFLAPYIKKDNLDYAEVYQCMQELIYNLNIPTRSGEIPFTNFSFDWVCPKDLYNQSPLVGGEVLEFTYGDCQPEMDMINKAFLEVMTKGDCNGRIFGFPIPTYSMTKEFDFTSENAKLLFELTAKYGSPYFQNFINSDLNPGDIRSMCCRLSLDLKQLKRRGGIFNAWDGTGSIGVVTINMPRLGYTAKDLTEFFNNLNDLLILAKDSLVMKRQQIDKLFEQGLFPYCKRWLKRGFVNHFCTIGIVGMNECLKNLFADQNKQLTEPEGKDFVIEVENFILSKLQEFQEDTGYLFNFEETPAEGCCYRFAKQDKKEFPMIYTSGTKESPYYTQGAKLPFDYTNDIFKILNHQQDIATKYTGGSVCHVFLGEKVKGSMAAKLVQTILTYYKTPYITLSPTFSICPDCGFHPGEIEKCPTCNQEMEIYSRIVGYYSPVFRWHDGKKQEFKDRETYEKVIYDQRIMRIDN